MEKITDVGKEPADPPSQPRGSGDQNFAQRKPAKRPHEEGSATRRENRGVKKEVLEANGEGAEKRKQ